MSYTKRVQRLSLLTLTILLSLISTLVWGQVEVTQVNRQVSVQLSAGVAQMEDLLNQNTHPVCESLHANRSLSDCFFEKTGSEEPSDTATREYCKNIHTHYPSLLDCIDQVGRRHTLNLSKQDARKYCATKSYRYYSLLDCVGQQQSAQGMYLGDKESRQVCQRMPIAFSSRAECLEQAKSEAGLKLKARQAEAYCQRAQIELPPAGTFRSLSDCVSTFKAQGQNEASALNQCRSRRIHYPSLRDCVDQATRSSGLKMSRNEARRFCAQPPVDYTSTIACVDQHFDKHGLNLSMDEARTTCRRKSFVFSSLVECRDQVRAMASLSLTNYINYCRDATYPNLSEPDCLKQVGPILRIFEGEQRNAAYCRKFAR